MIATLTIGKRRAFSPSESGSTARFCTSAGAGVSATSSERPAADGSARHHECPCVQALRNQAKEEPMADSPILICYDGSTDATRGIEAAAALLKDTRAVVLDVGPPLTVAESYAAVGATTPGFEELNEDAALSRAEKGAQLARDVGLTAEARGEVSAPTWDGVVQVADEIDAAVIVLGSRGLTGAKELLEGSFSHAVASHAGRPVLIVPPPASE